MTTRWANTISGIPVTDPSKTIALFKLVGYAETESGEYNGGVAYTYLARSGSNVVELSIEQAPPGTIAKGGINLAFNNLSVNPTDILPKIVALGFDAEGPADLGWDDEVITVHHPDGHELYFNWPLEKPAASTNAVDLGVDDEIPARMTP